MQAEISVLGRKLAIAGGLSLPLKMPMARKQTRDLRYAEDCVL
jgi:hypothetical protein